LKAVSNCDNLLLRRETINPSDAALNEKKKSSKACSRSSLLFFILSFLPREHPILSFSWTFHPKYYLSS
jgi:hypothetical protein